MNRPLNGSLRGWWKAAVLLCSLLQCVVVFLFLRLRGTPAVTERSAWLHRSCRIVLRRLGIALCASAPPPMGGGLLVSNHLSYLDILMYGATAPCVFVAKHEVRSWPILGLIAALGGTVFVDRNKVGSAAIAARQIEELLTEGILVLVFPEGTSSDGSEVLRFRPSLFEPAVRTATPILAAAIGYSACGGPPESALCYWGEDTFGPHLVRTLALPQLTASLHFSRQSKVFSDRKQAAMETWQVVVRLRAGLDVDLPAQSDISMAAALQIQ